MLELICFDICAFAILSTLYITISGKNLLADKAGRRLAALVLVTLISSFLNIAVIFYNSKPHEQVIVGYILLAAYHIMRIGTFYLFSSYIIAIMGTWHRTGNIYISSIRFVPCFIVAAVCASAPVFHQFYYYNSEGMYIRGPYSWIFYLCNAVFVIYAVYYVLINVKFIGIRKTAALAGCSLFSFAALLVQNLFPYMEVGIIGVTLSIVVIILFIDNPDDKLDEITGIKNASAFLEDIEMNFYTFKEFDLIHINIMNYKILEQMLSYDKYASILKKIGSSMIELNNRMHMSANMYFVREGRFRVVVDGEDTVKTQKFAEELSKVFNGEIEDNDMNINIESAINISHCPKDFKSLEEIIEFGNVYAKFNIDGEIGTAGDLIAKDYFNSYKNIDKLIESGLVNNRFRITFRPVYSIKESKICGVEAELRLFDESNGFLRPEMFRGVAEQNGSLNELGILEIELACRFMKENNLKALGIDTVGINLSAVQCLQKNMADTLIAIVEKYGLSTKNICLEITESVASDNQRVFTDTINRLSEYGFALVLDNYGTGYSNIVTLSKMPIVAVKFDSVFISDYKNEKLAVVLEKNIDMIRSLERDIIIDGISDAEQAKAVAALGCDYIQGKYYGEYMEQEEFIWFMREKLEQQVWINING